MKIKLFEILKILDSEKVFIVGNPEREIKRISSPENADENSLCVLWDKKFIENLDISVPIFAPKDFFDNNRDGISCEKPKELLPEIIKIFFEDKKFQGIHPSAVIEPGAVISEKAGIMANVYVGKNCFIGDGTIIEPNSVLLSDVKIGNNCLIHSGAVIGCDGFGFVSSSEGIMKIPQNGGVTIKDNVEIGACTTIDRGTLNDTFIDSGTKIDNHVQIGHNVKIGKNCIICSMSGIAGSSVIEDGVTISVQAGITDHVVVGKGTIIAARTGVTNDIAPGSLVSGFPARPHNEAKRALVLAADLPVLFKRLRILERKFNDFEKNNN